MSDSLLTTAVAVLNWGVMIFCVAPQTECLEIALVALAFDAFGDPLLLLTLSDLLFCFLQFLCFLEASFFFDNVSFAVEDVLYASGHIIDLIEEFLG